MARCFLFNYSDYLKELEYAKEEALIESIKLQTEKENAKERKKGKKGKKEKKHKSGKSKEREENSIKEESSHKKRKHSDRSQLGDQDDYIQEERSHKKRKHSDKSQLGDQDDSIQEECSHKKRKHCDRSQLVDQDDYIQEERSHKKRKHSDQDDCFREPMKDVIQQVDKSSLTEENGPPCFNLNPNDSSDSTQDSNKRKLAAPDALALPVRSARIFRIKPVQKPTEGERPADSVQLQPRFSGRDVDGEQLHVKNRGLLGQGSRDPWPPASNKLDDVLDRNSVLLPPFGLQKPTDGERPVTNVQLQPRFSGRAECGEQLLAKNRTPLIQKSSDPVAPSSNKLGSGVLDRNNHLLQKPADWKKSVTSVQYQPGLTGRAVDGGQLQAKNRAPVMQKSSNLVLPSSNKPAGVLRRNNVLLPKPTDGKKAATSALPQHKLSGRAVDGGQLQVKNTTPVIQKSSDLVPPSSHKLAGVLDRYNVLPESSELERPTDGQKSATNVPHQPRLSGRAVDEGKNRTPVIQKIRDPVPLSSNKLGIQKSRDPVPPSDKLAGVLDKGNFLPTPSWLQKPIDGKRSATSVEPQTIFSGKPTDGKRSATSVEPQTIFSGREVGGGQSVNNRTLLIKNNRDPAPQVVGVLDRVLPKSTNGEKPATSGQTESSFSGRAVDGPVKNRTPVSSESRDLGPPSSNKLDGVLDMNVDPPLPKVLQLEPPVSGRVMVGVTSQGHVRKSEHKSSRSRSRSGSKDEARRLFEKLIVNCIPPALQFDMADDDDQDWLFASKVSNVQRCVPSLSPPQQSDMLAYQPHATYVPQVEVYALPYVVPF